MPSDRADFDERRREIERAIGLSQAEKEYRLSVLGAIEKKVAQAGARTARAHAERAQQFMPFAALKGYEELVQAEEACALRKEEERFRQHEADDAAGWEGDDPC